MRALALGLVAGTGALQWQAALPASPMQLAIALVALATAVLAVFAGPRLRLTLLVVTGVLAGFSWAALVATHRLADRLPAEHEGVDIALTGVIDGLPQPFERGVRFILDVESAVPAAVRGRVALSWYGAPGQDAGLPSLRAGERWQVIARLKRPHTNANPHGFDYEAWLLEHDIRATGSVRARGEHVRIDALAETVTARVDRAREGIRERFRAAIPDGRATGVLIALVVGDQRAIRATDWATFNRTGVSHLMSISGLHVTMIASLVASIAGWLWRRSTRLVIAWPSRKAAAVAGALGAFVYCALAGFGIPAQRTLCMLVVAAVALAFDRTQSASRVLALALVAVLALDPWAVLAPGFWLSFFAVGILFYTTVTHDHGTSWLVGWARAQGAITLGLAPLTVLLFQQVSIVSPLANAIAIPVVSLVVTPLALLAALVPFDGIAFPILALAHACMASLMPLLEWMATLPAAVWHQHAPVPWTVPFALLGVLLLLAPRGVPARVLGWPLLAPLVFVLPPQPPHGEAWIDVLDVGQGLAVAVRTRKHVLLFDAGPAYSLEADAGDRVVVPFLRGEGVGRIDRLVVSHLDNDHSGGAVAVARWLGVDQVVSSLPADHPLHAHAPFRLPCTAGERWHWDGVEFLMLHPPVDDYAKKLKPNAMSCVLRVRAGGRTMLLTADIEAREEFALVVRSANELPADVMLVPHHGSRTSSTTHFIDAVNPRVAIIPAGYRNRFGHPRADVEARYVERGIEIARSDRDGAVHVKLRESGVVVERFREQRPRYWR